MAKWSHYSGIYLIATGIIHNIIGIMTGWPILKDIHQAGWWNTIESATGMHFDRSAILWFLLIGFFWMLMGYLMHLWLQRYQQRLPALIGYAFVMLGLITAIIIPASGAWLFIPQGLVIIIDSLMSDSSKVPV